MRRTLRAADVVATSNADDVRYAVERLGVSRGRARVVAQGLDDPQLHADPVVAVGADLQALGPDADDDLRRHRVRGDR